MLAVFGAVLFTQALLWLSFAPIESLAEAALGVGHLRIRFLALVNPLTFIVLAAAIGSMADRRGFRYTVNLGVCLMAPAAVARSLILRSGLAGEPLYAVMLALQVMIAAGTICCIACLLQMPVRWFPPEQRAGAAGLTSICLLAGNTVVFPLAVSLAGGIERAEPAVARASLVHVLDVFAFAILGAGALFLLFGRDTPPTPAGPVPPHSPVSAMQSLRHLVGLPQFRALSLLFIWGMGLYITMMTGMEKLMGFHGFDSRFAARVAAALTLGGIIGSALLSHLSDRTGRRRPFVVAPALAVLPMALLLAFLPYRSVDLAAAFLLGFFLLSAQPVIFAMLGEMEGIGPHLAGTAVGALFALGNIGAVTMPFLLEAGKRTTLNGLDYRWSLLGLALVGLAGFIAIVRLIPETSSQRASREP